MAMKTHQLLIITGGLTLAAISCGEQKNEGSKAEKKVLPSNLYYPTDYRSWTHVKTLILEEGHPLFESFGGMHHIYANAEAMEGYKNNHRFPDGSYIVFDLLQDIRKDNAIAEGDRKVIGVMYKNSAIFSETGGWAFGAFENQQGIQKQLNAKEACFSCHLSQKDRDYVFSDFRP